MRAAPGLSVIIPSHGGGHRLPETLAALAAAQRPESGFEVLVADDGSEPPIAVDTARWDMLSLRIVRLDSRHGRAAACNRLLSVARAAVVLVLDDDMTVAPDVLRGHVSLHERVPKRAVIGRIDPDPSFFRGRFGRFLADEELRRRQALLDAGVAIPFTLCLTGHFSIGRDELLRAGGYSEAFSLYGYEDLELAHRLISRGVELVYTDELVAVHRSEHAGFRKHCERHLESGTMAVVFALRAKDERVDRFLRIHGMSVGAESGAFRKLMALSHGVTRRSPRRLVPVLLGCARLGTSALEIAAPTRLLHAAYHLTRDMYYAAGLVEALEGRIPATGGSEKAPAPKVG